MNGQRPKKAVNSKIRPNKAIQLIDSIAIEKAMFLKAQNVD